jgi:YD repeat-containing protein
MTRPSRIAKRLVVPMLLAAGLLVAAQVVLAAPPTASFEVSAQAAGGCGTFTFTSTSTDPDNDIQSTEWDLDGDGTFDAGVTGSPVTHTYATPGQRSVTMRVTDAAGGDDTTEDTSIAPAQMVNVQNQGQPNGAVSASPNPAQPNQSVTFSAAGSTDPGGAITRYEWDLDNNGSYETDTAATPTATVAAGFAAGGPHTVGLRVTDSCGAQDTATGTVVVQNSNPIASFTVSPNPAPLGATITFNAAASSDPGGSIVKYEWDFDNNDVFELDTLGVSSTTKQNLPAGFYAVQLRVTDNNGATNTTLRTFRVNAKPVASFSYVPLSPLIGDTVTFDGTSSGDPDGTVASYAWDLDGNGSFETNGATPARTYTAAATVSVKLRVTDNNGTVSDVLARDVTIQATRPNAGFTYSPRYPLPGQPVTLTSTSSPSTSPSAPALVATQWDLSYSPFVDFTIDGAGTSLVTSFATPGPHPVAVKVTESGGGFAIATDTIVVNAPPQAAFTVTPAKPQEGRSVTFASTSTDPDDPLVKQEWDLDNNGSYERTGAVVTSNLKKGIRPIHLRVTDSRGAAVTSTQQVKVAKKPPRPAPDVTKTLGYARRDWGLQVVVLIVRVPKQTTVKVQCKGRGCPRATFTKRSKKKPAQLTFSGIKSSLRAGATITVISSRTGSIAEYFTYRVRGDHKRPVKIKRCRAPGAKKFIRCAS